MKQYPSISGPSKAPPNAYCIAFAKYDGSNLRFEWSRKQGWHKFGTRRRLFDVGDPEYGRAIPIFQNHYAEGLEKVFADHKDYRKIERATVFCEFYGEESFAGYHNFEKPFNLKLFDVEVYKRGFVIPSTFVCDFGHLGIPEIIYEGNLDQDFIRSVINNDVSKYPLGLGEGVVAKGVIECKGGAQHGLWMVKVKTKTWLAELRRRAADSIMFKQALEENEREQTIRE